MDYTIVCLLADNAILAVANSNTEHHCFQCGRRVLMAPSSQRMLVASPNTRIACIECAAAAVSQEKAEVRGTVANPEELQVEMQTVLSNPWRNRN